ncbi:TRAP transporter permease [Evansella cellulosilytica]|uniref:TRAP transporter, 4TM/12TM fusion protein n=1 Tax=Evansella cellulosilytica (strain ATCC 21833 / DSM 2522 / FERM P-1141 / JCM 9156 / N-4) TaxID=649639 RepID=E6TY10_EVAC2|nr:TRAP transporter permease [Evansella cellulosilytica]ADU31223.1 TRAP transporter, 4TM/12TM fusion protein [Evansella cellulosilytica DSM 2522]
MEVKGALTEEQQQEMLSKFDRESAYRRNTGKWKWVISFIAISLTLFHLYRAFPQIGPLGYRMQGAVHLGTALGLIFLLYPARKIGLKKSGVPWYDVLLAFLAMGSTYYILFRYDWITGPAILLGYTTIDIAVATIGIILLFEATRRAVGVPIIVIAGVAILYGLFGTNLPYIGHTGFSWDRLAQRLFYTTDAIFGTPIQISSTFIFLFLFFGVMLTKTGVGQYFNDLAFGATGKYTGGTAKAAVAASAMQGMVTGSSVANTVSSGSFTIPMMKRAKFKPEFAAAAEASASTGGQIMPPIMGAAAFIMAEYVESVSYSDIIIIGIIPAILYFTGVFFGTHFEAKKHGITGLPKDQLPTLRGIFKRIYLLAPLVAIISMLLLGFTATTAALYGIGAAFLVSFFRKDTRMKPRDIIDALEQGARVALPVIAACATAGIIVGVVVFTGLGTRIAGGLINMAGDSLFLLLFFTMFACILLGMGLPTTANYVVTATMAAPALIQFGIEPIAAHFFVFYFGIVADITPPVCLAAYAGSGIAKANPMKAGVTAFKLAIAAFIIPYVFVYNPVLLLQDATLLTLIPVLITALLGMAAISAAMMNYFVYNPIWYERILLFAAGIMLIVPENLPVELAGLALLVLVGIIQWLRKKKHNDENGENRNHITT